MNQRWTPKFKMNLAGSQIYIMNKENRLNFYQPEINGKYNFKITIYNNMKNINYVGINLSKDVQSLLAESNTLQRKKIMRPKSINRKIYHFHGLEYSTL